MRGVYAIGDVTGEPMLAQRALEFGPACRHRHRGFEVGQFRQFLDVVDATLAQAHQRLVDRDLAQPAPERRVAAELRAFVEYGKHGVVQNLSGLVAVVEQAPREGVHRLLEQPVHLLQRPHFPALQSLHQELRDVDGKARPHA